MLIPDSILNKERALTADEISIYRIDAGPGGISTAEWHPSFLLELYQYQFRVRFPIMDEHRLYYLTIRKTPSKRESMESSLDPHELDRH
jgi:hypothetical protein